MNCSWEREEGPWKFGPIQEHAHPTPLPDAPAVPGGGDGAHTPGAIYQCRQIHPWPFHQVRFANVVIAPLLNLLKKKLYTLFPPNEIGRMIDNVLSMLTTQFRGSFHINKICDYYNSGCPGFLIKFRSFARSTGVRQL